MHSQCTVALQSYTIIRVLWKAYLANTHRYWLRDEFIVERYKHPRLDRGSKVEKQVVRAAEQHCNICVSEDHSSILDG